MRSLFRTRTLFDGFMRPGDVRLAGELGADAVAFQFGRESTHSVRVEAARSMRQAITPLVGSVASFANNTQQEVREAIKQLRPNLAIFAGEEEDAFCRAFGIPFLKTFKQEALVPGMDGKQLHAKFPSAAGFVFRAAQASSTTSQSDWKWMPSELTKPFLLSGGFRIDEIFEIITTVEPWGIVVCDEIEARHGLKDGELMRQVVFESRRADCHEVQNACEGTLPDTRHD